MREVNGVHTQTFNRRDGRSGHVLQGRFKAPLVDKDHYLLELSRYVVLNPVRAGMVESAADWSWSNYLATMGRAKALDWLAEHTLASWPRASVPLTLGRIVRELASSVIKDSSTER